MNFVIHEEDLKTIIKDRFFLNYRLIILLTIILTPISFCFIVFFFFKDKYVGIILICFDFMFIFTSIVKCVLGYSFINKVERDRFYLYSKDGVCDYLFKLEEDKLILRCLSCNINCVILKKNIVKVKHSKKFVYLISYSQYLMLPKNDETIKLIDKILVF